MVLPDHELVKWASRGGIDPFDPACVNPASIDLRISITNVIGLRSWSSAYPEDTLTILPGYPILVSTVEYLQMPRDCAGIVFLKSSLARRGLDHALAGFVDPGFEGELTLELHAHRPITLVPRQRIIQLVLYRLESAPVKIYNGKYQRLRGPQRAR